MTITTSEIIALALCDKTSFNAIEIQTGLSEQEVIKVMQQNLKPKSFKVWRKRATGNKMKHQPQPVLSPKQTTSNLTLEQLKELPRSKQ